MICFARRVQNIVEEEDLEYLHVHRDDARRRPRPSPSSKSFALHKNNIRRSLLHALTDPWLHQAALRGAVLRVNPDVKRVSRVVVVVVVVIVVVVFVVFVVPDAV